MAEVAVGGRVEHAAEGFAGALGGEVVWFGGLGGRVWEGGIMGLGKGEGGAWGEAAWEG